MSSDRPSALANGGITGEAAIMPPPTTATDPLSVSYKVASAIEGVAHRPSEAAP